MPHKTTSHASTSSKASQRTRTREASTLHQDAAKTARQGADDLADSVNTFAAADDLDAASKM
jgi:hypothetical protein